MRVCLPLAKKLAFYELFNEAFIHYGVIQGDQKVSVLLLITIQKLTNNVQNVLPSLRTLLGSI
jgi:hypothetical protein